MRRTQAALWTVDKDVSRVTGQHVDAGEGGSVLGPSPVGSRWSVRMGRRTGLARSSVHRLVTDLVELGWVHRVGNRYELGMALFEL